MPKITSVVPQKKTLRLRSGRDPHRFNIYLDGQFAFGADEDLVVEQRLIVGKVLDEKMIEQLLFEAEIGKLMERMYRLFNIRQRSEKEVRDYFRIKGKEQVSDLVIELVIKKLKQKRMLNDEEFARSWVEARSKLKGIQVIKSELYKKGISKEIIDTVITLESDQEQVAEKLLQKRLPRWIKLPLVKQRKKAYEFLLRRGFQYDQVRDVIEKLTKKD